MATFRAIANSLFAGLLCLSLLVWSVAPAHAHAPAVIETIHDHLQMIEDHGHSHGFAEDLFWAMHGHSHDVADHDHSPAFLLAPGSAPRSALCRDTWCACNGVSGPNRHFRIDRPPRL